MTDSTAPNLRNFPSLKTNALSSIDFGVAKDTVSAKKLHRTGTTRECADIA